VANKNKVDRVHTVVSELPNRLTVERISEPSPEMSASVFTFDEFRETVMETISAVSAEKLVSKIGSDE
jgi:hypothetical protein